MHRLLIVQARVVKRLRRRNHHAPGPARGFMNTLETARASRVNGVADDHRCHEVRDVVGREELPAPVVAKLKHHVRLAEHVGESAAACTNGARRDHRLDALLEGQRELSQHPGKPRHLFRLVFAGDLQIALLSWLKLGAIDAVADRERCQFDEIAEHRIDVVAVRKLIEQGDQVALVRVGRQIMFALCALLAHAHSST